MLAIATWETRDKLYSYTSNYIVAHGETSDKINTCVITE